MKLVLLIRISYVVFLFRNWKFIFFYFEDFFSLSEFLILNDWEYFGYYFNRLFNENGLYVLGIFLGM